MPTYKVTYELHPKFSTEIEAANSSEAAETLAATLLADNVVTPRTITFTQQVAVTGVEEL